MSGGARTRETTQQNTAQTVQLPQWMLDAGQGLYARASATADTNPIQAYSDQLSPNMARNQTAAGNIAATSGNAGQADLQNARASTMAAVSTPAPTIGTQRTQAQGYAPTMQTQTGPDVQADRVSSQNFGAQQARDYMNPHTQQVQQNTLAEMVRQNQMENDGLGDSAQAARAYGGTRHAVLEGETRGRQNLNMMDYLSSSNESAFNAARDQFNTDRSSDQTAQLANQGSNLNADQFNRSMLDQLLGRNMDAANRASEFGATARNTATQANADRALSASQGNANIGQSMLDRMLAAGGQFGQLGETAQGMTSDQINNLLRTGAVEQATQGDNLRARYEEFLRMQDAPMERDRDLMAILSGTPRNVTTTGNMSGNTTTRSNPGLLNTLLGAGQVAAAAFSDRRMKTDIERIATRDDGLGVYEYRYIWQSKHSPKHVGVMADEVSKLRPDAAGPMVGGMATVNYDKIGALA